MNIIKSLIVWIVAIIFMTILFPLTLFIWLLVLPFDKDRYVIHWILIYQSLLLTRVLPIWKIDIKGMDKYLRDATYVVISNHQSILDILLLNCLRLRFKWISKIENHRVPLLGWYLRMAGYITVDRGNEESKALMLEKSLNLLKRGISIMIFPEGTRSLNREIGFFKRGAFQLAMQASVPILPILVDGTGGFLPKHGFIFSNNKNITVRVLDPVLPSSFINDTPEELALKIAATMADELKNIRNGLNIG